MTKFEEFRKNGYVVLKNVLTISEIKELRKLSYVLFENKYAKMGANFSNTSEDRLLYAKTFIDNPKLIDSLFKKNIIDQIKEVFGDDYVTFVQYSLGDNLHSPVWHNDSQSQGFSTQYVYNTEYNIAKCGLYFQEDDKTYGGQLDIMPGSHLPTFLGVNSPFTLENRYGKVSKIQLFAMKIRDLFIKKISVNLPAGDILLFHGLLWHRASQPNWSKVKKIHTFGIENPPKDKRKFMVQWEVSPNNEFAKIYATHQQLRGVLEKQTLFVEANKFSVNNYSESTKKLIKTNGVTVKSYKELSMSVEANNIKAKDGTPIVLLIKDSNENRSMSRM